MDLQKQIIWVMRPVRTGGTWFCKRLAQILNRDFYFINKDTFQYLNITPKEYFKNRYLEIADYTRILNTHHFFSALPSLHRYNNPIVIRLERKNKYEQFLSRVYSIQTNKFHNYNKNLEVLPTLNNLSVTEQEVDQFIEKLQNQQITWDEYKNQFISETVYYEDLLNGYTLKTLPNVYVSMKEHIIDLPLKLTYNKEIMLLNQDKIRQKFVDTFGEVAQTVRAMDS